MGQEILNSIYETEEIGKFQTDTFICENSTNSQSEITCFCCSLQQTHEVDIQKLFNHETRKELLSLAKTGENRGRVKADLLLCIKTERVPTQTELWTKAAE